MVVALQGPHPCYQVCTLGDLGKIDVSQASTPKDATRPKSQTKFPKPRRHDLFLLFGIPNYKHSTRYRRRLLKLVLVDHVGLGNSFYLYRMKGLLWWSVVETPPVNAGDTGSTLVREEPKGCNHCPMLPTAHALQQEKPLWWRIGSHRRSPRLPQLDKAHEQQQRPRSQK